MNFKNYILKNFPDAKIDRLKEANEVNIGCINPKCEDFWKNCKYKLGVNVKTGKFQCWRCGIKGRTAEDFMELMGDKQLLDEISEVNTFNDVIQNLQNPIEKEEIRTVLELPNMCVSANFSERGVKYLKRRKITSYHIAEYSILYCGEGTFKQRIIFPDYDLKGNLIFYQGRHIYDAVPKTLNAKVDRNKYIYNYYNIIRDYKRKNYLIITEGIFDCITIDGCAIALMGKFCSDYQFNMILKLKKKRIYMFLDMDAKLDSIKLCKKFDEAGIETYMVVLDKYKDPSEAGKKECYNALKNAKKFNYNLLIKQYIGE